MKNYIFLFFCFLFTAAHAQTAGLNYSKVFAKNKNIYNGGSETPPSASCILNKNNLGGNAFILNNGVTIVDTAGGAFICVATIGVKDSVRYWEAHIDSTSAGMGLGISTFIPNGLPSGYIAGKQLGDDINGWSYQSSTIGSSEHNNVYNFSYGIQYAKGNVVSFKLDMNALTITCYVDSVSQGVMYSGLPAATLLYPCASNYSGNKCGYTFNFSPASWKYHFPGVVPVR